MDLEAESRALAIAALAGRPPVDQLRSPLDYIFAEHFRQRSLCRILCDLAAQAHLDREMAKAALDFLRTDFGLHVVDEEKDLFPLLRRRRQRQDRMNDILGTLSAEHAADAIDANHIIAALAAALDDENPVRLDDAARALMTSFAANERRHLTTENAIVLPLARARLTIADLETLGRHMAARRSVTYPEGRDAV
jgi:hemerythrin-like domain-containing protein